MSLQAVQSAGSSMKNIQIGIDIVAHNVANVNTTAYKTKKVNFESVINGSGNRHFSGTAVNSISSNFSQGRLKATSQATDLALQGRGFFTLQNSAGELIFTRAGHFKIDSLSTVVDPDGNYVLSVGGGRITLPKNAEAMEINAAGEIHILYPGQQEFQYFDQFQLASFVNPQSLENIGGNAYRESLNSGPAEFSNALASGTSTAETTVVSGTLESSNADLSIELTDMIAYQRSFQAVSKVATTANDLLDTTLNLIR